LLQIKLANKQNIEIFNKKKVPEINKKKKKKKKKIKKKKKKKKKKVW